MRIGTNVLSMNARQSLYENEKRMNVTIEHLATGKKLNHASDNQYCNYDSDACESKWYARGDS
ncbi:hypothetical protein SAMN04488573_101770 [Bacillus sp. 5mfcol3.1]|nr:hypothetical protein SAMN04488573_101770 [Bacillus sp. 5mfcol3.1]